MSKTEYLIDTNILIYHTKGSQSTVDFISHLISQRAFHMLPPVGLSPLTTDWDWPPVMEKGEGGHKNREKLAGDRLRGIDQISAAGEQA